LGRGPVEWQEPAKRRRGERLGGSVLLLQEMAEAQDRRFVEHAVVERVALRPRADHYDV